MPSATISRRSLRASEALVVRLGRDETGDPIEAIVVLSEGAPRAYLNRCRHLPIPLDAGSRRFLSPDRLHLVCVTHGARFRTGDGQCVEGPCEGQPLHPIAIEELADGRLRLHAP